MPVRSRAESLAAISNALKRIGKGIQQAIRGTKIIEQHFESCQAFGSRRWRANQDRRYYCGIAYPPAVNSVSEAVEDAFGYAATQVTSFQDLYAGKIVAALDHQHPRDFLDVRDLLAMRACDDAFRRAFIVYMLGHHRPMSEALAPKRKDISLGAWICRDGRKRRAS
ncbi:nucleotidyl transferase AbiEii/AbiGii toxin family protein [Bradyrhizobium sp. BWA-3-5]|uniref:nucleotidyl transferase AbiEii/AbiGii toxin family protein n=1 Tax=Bradyrhizobium sp. BWA-3-5 TaxID=3080013 RepID=UPI003978A0DF